MGMTTRKRNTLIALQIATGMMFVFSGFISLRAVGITVFLFMLVYGYSVLQIPNIRKNFSKAYAYNESASASFWKEKKYFKSIIYGSVVLYAALGLLFVIGASIFLIFAG